MQVIDEVHDDRTVPPADGATGMLARLTRAAGRVTSEQSRLLRDLGLSPSAFAILLELAASDGDGVQPCTLADRLSVTRSSVCGLIDGLEDKGLVVRGPHDRDGRRIIVRLTDRGDAMLATHCARYETGLQPLVAGLSDSEQRHLVRLLDRIGA